MLKFLMLKHVAQVAITAHYIVNTRLLLFINYFVQKKSVLKEKCWRRKYTVLRRPRQDFVICRMD